MMVGEGTRGIPSSHCLGLTTILVGLWFELEIEQRLMDSSRTLKICLATCIEGEYGGDLGGPDPQWIVVVPGDCHFLNGSERSIKAWEIDASILNNLSRGGKIKPKCSL